MTAERRPGRLDQTADFATLLASLEKAVSESVIRASWLTLVGIRAVDTVVRHETVASDMIFLDRVRKRMPTILRKAIRQDRDGARPDDVYLLLGDAHYVIFHDTPDAKAFDPIERILDGWRQALNEALMIHHMRLERALHIGMVSWSSTVRRTSARELLGYGTFMLDEAGRTAVDPAINELLKVPASGFERVHLARFRWS